MYLQQPSLMLMICASSLGALQTPLCSPSSPSSIPLSHECMCSGGTELTICHRDSRMRGWCGVRGGGAMSRPQMPINSVPPLCPFDYYENQPLSSHHNNIRFQRRFYSIYACAKRTFHTHTSALWSHIHIFGVNSANTRNSKHKNSALRWLFLPAE